MLVALLVPAALAGTNWYAAFEVGYDRQFLGDTFPGGLQYGARGGVEYDKFDIGVVVPYVSGTLDDTGWPWNHWSPRVEVMWHPDPKATFDFFAGGGLGYRYARIDDGTTTRSQVADTLGIHADPILDALVSAGGGVTWQVWGPVHVRADLRVVADAGEQPTGHVFVGGEGGLGVELRPEGPPDRDRDGVPDIRDQCPDDPEDIDNHDDYEGCPDLDDDGDGIPDKEDQCAEAAEDKDGVQDEDGCPDPNNDLDNQPDSTDKCPNDPEVLNGFEDGDGCPDTLPADLDAWIDKPIPGVRFSGAAHTPESEATLKELAATLLKYPDVKVTLYFYTDESSNDLTALRDLTRARGEKVRAFLVSQGVAEGRMDLRAWGSQFAVQPNTTPEGREANNRMSVELQR